MSESTRCYLNSHFGMAVQGVLALTAFCILIVKRMREPKKERRPVLVWVCDTSKQGIGAMLIHFANVVLASLSHEKDQCTWYFINYLLDTTFGLLVIWFILKLVQCIAARKGWLRLKMGEYGSPPEFKTWLQQCIVYICVVVIEKIVILLLFQLHFWMTVKKFILKPISGYPKVELVIVILIVPFIMNALMFWAIDNFLMRKTRKYIAANGFEEMQYSTGKLRHNVSDDEAVMHLIDNESKDTLMNNISGSENEYLHHRSESLSSRERLKNKVYRREY